MGRYAAACTAGVTSSITASLVCLQGNTTHRGHVYDIMWGSSATPDDVAVNHRLRRFTAAPAGTGGGQHTPAPLDLADPASLMVATTATTGGTFGADLILVGSNLRSTQRWVAAPEGELVLPATNASGAMWLSQHASHTGTMAATIHWLE